MRRQRQLWAHGLAVSVLMMVAGCGQPMGGSEASRPPVSPSATADEKAPRPEALPGMVAAEEARAQLAGLKVAPADGMKGYSRSKFSHWSEQGDKCNTRELVLHRDGKDVVQDDECRAVSGTWTSLYDGVTVSDAAKMDIDHMVPLAEAWRSGASTWDADKRKAFANDRGSPQLLAVTASSNRSKGDQSPDLWQPDKAFWCDYGRAWTTVKSGYGLSVTKPEKATLTEMLGTCS